MGIVKSAADLLYTFRFLKLLVTPFEETDAYKAGIIDEDGIRRKDFSKASADNRKAYKEYYTPFHRLVYNVKRFLSNAPGGKSRLASYAAALYLIREQYDVPEDAIEKGLKDLGVDLTDILAEQSQWYVLENKLLSPGVYRLNENKDELVKKFDQIRVPKDSYPVGDIFGISIYEVTHLPTNQNIYITTEELRR